MPSWSEILSEIGTTKSPHDRVRRKYLSRLYKITGRNVIVYYSGWLQKPELIGRTTVMSINDNDINGFMATIYKLDRKKGLDLILHTPGGDLASTEAIVNYLRNMFGTNIRAIIPQIALSGGTMIACACESILMGKQSSLGPIDPQFRGRPAHGVIEEFEKACKECKNDPTKIPLWQPIIAKYDPTLIGECQKAIAWSKEIVKEWLIAGMFRGNPDAEEKADNIINELGDHALTKSHARHLSASKCKEIGLNVEMLEDKQKLQEAVLTIHHACIQTLSDKSAVKIMENHKGKAFIISVKTQ